MTATTQRPDSRRQRPRRAGERLRPFLVYPLIGALAAVAGLPFGGVFDGWSFQIAAVTAAAVVTAIAVLAAAKRWLVGETVGALLVAFIFAGAIVVNLVPTPQAVGDLLRGAVRGWSELLSVAPPAASSGTLRAVPFAAAFFGAAVGCELARSTRFFALPAIGPLITLALAILFTPEERDLALIAGGFLAVGLLVLTRLRADMSGEEAPSSRTGMFRIAALVSVLALVTLAAPLVGPRLPGADANERFDLRQYQRNPFDPLATPSPLVTFKSELASDRESDPVFTVSGDTRVTRFPVATMTVFDGVVWAVADGSTGQQADEFVPVSERLPGAPYPTPTEEIRLDFELAGLEGPWLPRAGWVTRVDSNRDSLDLRLNERTGTLALNGGFFANERLTIWSRPQVEADDLDLSLDQGLGVDSEAATLQTEFPLIVNLFGELTQGAPSGLGHVTRIQQQLRDQGFYLDDVDAKPGHSYRRIIDFLAEPEAIQGYGEQYAAAAAVLARGGGIPARVVVGYQIDEARWSGGRAEVRAGDVSAWIEVLFAGSGWVAFDVTPDKNREPLEQEQGIVQEPVAIPNPPPPPPPPPTPNTTIPQEAVDDDELDEAEDDDDVTNGEGGISLSPVFVVAGATVGFPLVISAIFLVVVMLLKRRRRSQRRSGDPTNQVLGAWGELHDRFGEAGMRAGPADTPQESISAIGAAASRAELSVDVDRLRRLAKAADRAAYAPTVPSEQLVEDAWRDEADAVSELRGQLPRRRRLTSLADPRPLWRKR